MKDMSNLQRMKTSVNLVAEVSSSWSEAATHNVATLSNQVERAVHFAGDQAAQFVPEPLAAAGIHAIDILSEAPAPVHRAKEAVAAHVPEQAAARSRSFIAHGAHVVSAFSKATTELASHFLPGQATSYTALFTFNSNEADGVNDDARTLAKAVALKVKGRVLAHALNQDLYDTTEPASQTQTRESSQDETIPGPAPQGEGAVRERQLTALFDEVCGRMALVTPAAPPPPHNPPHTEYTWKATQEHRCSTAMLATRASTVLSHNLSEQLILFSRFPG